MANLGALLAAVNSTVIELGIVLGTAVAVDRLRVVRGDSLVLEGVTCTIAAGTVTGLIGPSGSGKSTLMRAVVGIQRVAGGSVSVFGHPAGAPPVRRRVGYVTQAPSVYGDLTVLENLRYFAAILDAPRTRVAEVIEAVSLASHADRRIDRLSGGQRSRASLAAALLPEPDVLILDEPTVGLDPLLREELWALFGTLAERGAALLVSSHVMEEAGRCERLLLLREGRLLADSTPDELRRRTGAQDLDAAFLHLVRPEVTA